MNGFANSGWLNEKGEKLVMITAIDPRTSDLKQFERDCYDSGLVAGLKSERLRIIELLERLPLERVYSSVMNCLDESGCFDYESALAEKKNLIALIKGEK